MRGLLLPVAMILAACGAKVSEQVARDASSAGHQAADAGEDSEAAACGVSLPQTGSECSHCAGSGWQCGADDSYVVPDCPAGANATIAGDACSVEDGGDNTCTTCDASGKGFLLHCVACNSTALGGCWMGAPVSCSM